MNVVQVLFMYIYIYIYLYLSKYIWIYIVCIKLSLYKYSQMCAVCIVDKTHLFRCQWDASKQWKFVCKDCWSTGKWDACFLYAYVYIYMYICIYLYIYIYIYLHVSRCLRCIWDASRLPKVLCNDFGPK
jgi:hypothetical protein